MLSTYTRTDTSSVSDRIAKQSERDEYEEFDDYLEMITQFGYITLFASAYPLASVLAIVENLMEIWSDSWRLCFLTRRPDIVTRANNMHYTWVYILQFMTWVSIITNAILFAFTSEQMEEWFPQWYQHQLSDEISGFEELKGGKGRYVVLVMFGLEHMVGILCFMIYTLCDDVPEAVRIKVARRRYLLEERLFRDIKKVKR